MKWIKLLLKAALEIADLIEKGKLSPEEAERRVQAALAAIKGRHADARKWLGIS